MRLTVFATVVVSLGVGIAWWVESHESTGRTASQVEIGPSEYRSRIVNLGDPMARSTVDPNTIADQNAQTHAAAPTAARDQPLPPIDHPLREVVDELRARADAGDARAACRLASEMERCGTLASRLGRLSEQTRQHQLAIERTSDPKAREQMEKSGYAVQLSQRADSLLTEGRHCEGVAPDPPAERFRRWREAALAGHGPSMRHYAAGNAFRWHDLLEVSESLVTYRREAEAIARSVAGTGDTTTTFALAMAYSPPRREVSRYFLAQSVEGDAIEALALFRFLEASVEPGSGQEPDPMRAALAQRIEELERSMEPADLAAASARAASYLATWAPRSAVERAELGAIVAGGVPDIAPGACNQSAGVPPALDDNASPASR